MTEQFDIISALVRRLATGEPPLTIRNAIAPRLWYRVLKVLMDEETSEFRESVRRDPIRYSRMLQEFAEDMVWEWDNPQEAC